MMDAISGISGGSSINQFLAAARAQKAESLRQVDADIRTQAIRKAAASGAEGAVVTNLQYTIGPDGQLYATGGTVTTQKRIDGPKSFSRIPSQDSRPEQQPANDNRNFLPQRELSLADIINPQLDISSAAFAELFSNYAAEGLAKDKLQLADIGTRAHERQHFFAAGGLASGTPEYDYATGPDGELYAVAGSVEVKATATSDPEKASRDALGLSIAATAPGDASPQDLKVAKGAYSKAASYYSQANYLGNDQLFNLVA